MASIISRKTKHFRYTTRFLCSHLLHHRTPTSPSPLFSHHLHLSSQPLHHPPHLVGNQGYGNGSLVLLCQRFLSGTAASSTNQEKPASDNSSKDDSGQGKESAGEQEQTSDAASTNQEKPASDNSSKDDSGQGKESAGEQEQTSDAASTNQEKPSSDNSSKDDSGQGKESAGEQEQTSDTGKPVRGSPVSWLSFLLLVLTGAGLVVYYDREKKRHIEEIHNASEAVKQGPSAGKAAIGGPFQLTNHHGKRVTEKDFLGKWTLLYFGFTHCPDICPEELQKLAAAVDKIKEKAGIETVPVFISVDPERDTVEQVGEYVKEFHPKLIGLTGSSDEIKSVARAYRVYYMKTAEEDSDYLVDHSIVIYLMGPDMQFVKFFGKNNDVDSLADGVIKEIKQYKK